MPKLCCIGLCCLLSACQPNPTSPTPQTKPTPSKPTHVGQQTLTPNIPFLQTQAMDFDRIIKPGDRVLFIGDEMTQQRFYTRAVAGALLGLLPHDDLRFFNGGYAGSDPAKASQWIDSLLDLCQPTVVFICFGLEHAQTLSPMQYDKDITRLVKKIKLRVNQIVLISPPARDTGLSNLAEDQKVNHPLFQLAKQAQRTAKRLQVGYIDLFVPMQRIYISLARHQAKRPGNPGNPRNPGPPGPPDTPSPPTAHRRSILTIDGLLPNEPGHVIIASHILFAIGLTPQQLNPIGWSPLRRSEMRVIQGMLGLELAWPNLPEARKNMALYQSLRQFDLAFFKAWRLDKNVSKSTNKKELRQKIDRMWLPIRQSIAPYQR